MVVESTINLHTVDTIGLETTRMCVSIHKELHLCNNHNKNHESNEGEDVMSNFKMALVVFIKSHLIVMDYAWVVTLYGHGT